MRSRLRNLLIALLSIGSPGAAAAQESVGFYAGALAGVATLSGDPSAIVTSGGFAVSQYKPENGFALNLLFGAHLREYVTVQANYIWNRNDLALFSGAASGGVARFYDQSRRSSQHAIVGDLLVYFRERASRIRPYLSGGVGIVRFDSASTGTPIDGGAPLPPRTLTSTDATLRVAVGVDVAVGHRWSVRYSFSESIGGNPVSPQLDPPGSRGLMNFQNLVGVIREF